MIRNFNVRKSANFWRKTVLAIFLRFCPRLKKMQRLPSPQLVMGRTKEICLTKQTSGYFRSFSQKDLSKLRDSSSSARANKIIGLNHLLMKAPPTTQSMRVNQLSQEAKCAKSAKQVFTLETPSAVHNKTSIMRK